MIKQRLSRQWYFQYAGADTWQTVDIPHDYMISLPRDPKAPDGSRNGFFPVADGRYVKYIHTPDSSHAILDLDGAYMCAHIKINENLEGIHPYGYAPFLVDLSGKLRPDEINKLEIDTSVMMRSTRWYTGGGLCRDVFLWTGGMVRIEPRDIFVRTSGVSETGANVQMEAVVTSDIRAKVELRVSIRGTEEQLSGTGNQEILVQPGQRHPVKMNFQIESPRVWSTEEPHLYHLTAEILWEDKVEDTTELDFGVRTLQVDARAGLRLNGISVKLRGGCIHHDHGALGAAAFPEAEERKVRLLKAVGFNAIRIAHNPPSLALLEICDRVGMLVMDEAFDMWNQPKNPGDYHLWFADWWERDLTAMVLRDRNHPCVISYSIGNEIEERDGNSDGAVWSVRLAKKVKELDPTRPVTAAVCSIWDRPEVIDPKEYRKNRHEEDPNADSWEKRTEGFLAPLDIVGYNYLYERYEQDHERYPERVMWGSETHTLHFYDSWKLVEEHPYVLGDFTWTAFDNLGEAGAGRGIWERDGVIRGLSRGGYPWRSCWQGDFDLCGYRRPQSYFREAVWRGGCEPRIFTTHPEHYGESYSGTGWHWYDVSDSWTFPKEYIGKPVRAEVYTDAEEVEFLLNGKTIGRAEAQKGVAALSIPYEKGKLTARTYRKHVFCGESSLCTAGPASSVAVIPEKQEIMSDNRDLCYFDISILDEKGIRVPGEKQELTAVADGGELLCIFSGDPANEDAYTSGSCHAWDGRAVAVVRASAPGKVRLIVEAKGLRTGTAVVTAR